MTRPESPTQGTLVSRRPPDETAFVVERLRRRWRSSREEPMRSSLRDTRPLSADEIRMTPTTVAALGLRLGAALAANFSTLALGEERCLDSTPGGGMRL